MDIRKLVVEFGSVFAITLVTVALVTYLWNVFAHGQSTVDWRIAFSFAITFGFIVIRVRLRETNS